jgi:hypothetical protein
MAEDWRTLKLPEEVFEAYKEIQKELKEKHKKPFSNTDTMKFLMYLAKVALELEGNPKIEGLAEPIVYTTLEKLDVNCQSVANEFKIPINYLREGVLWGLLELAKEEIKNGNWKKCKYYLELARNWFNEYELSHLYVCREEISKMIADIINEIPRIGQNNPNRKKIHEQLFKELEDIVLTFFENPPYNIIEAVILNEIRSQKYDRALRFLKMALRKSEDSEKLLKKFLKEVGKNLESEEYKKYVEELLRASTSYYQELNILETASEFIDVKPFYEELISRKYLSPEDRFEIIKSMVKASSNEKNSSLIEYAISRAKDEFKKQKDMGYNIYIRVDFAYLLAEYGFSDKIIELKFPDEVPTMLYYLITGNFEEKWNKLKHIIAKHFCRWGVYQSSISNLFIPADMADDELDEDVSIDLNEVFKKLKVKVIWDWDEKNWYEKTWRLEVEYENKPTLYIPHLLPENVLEQLLKKLLESGAEPVLGCWCIYDELRTIKLLKRIGCKNHADKLKDKLIKKIIEDPSIYDKYIVVYYEDFMDGGYGIANEDNPEYIGNPEYVKFLHELGINLLDILKKAVNDLFKKELNNRKYQRDETIVEACINILVYYKHYEEVFELIESGNIFKVLYDDFKLFEFDEVSAERTRYFEVILKKHKKWLIDTFIDALIEKKGPKFAAEFILEHNIATSKLDQLIKKLIEKGHIDLADKLYSEFGLGWFGHEYLEPILIFRFEKCIDSLKKGNEEFSENYKAAFSLLRSSRKKLSSDRYEILGGKLVGRLIAWELIHSKVR